MLLADRDGVTLEQDGKPIPLPGAQRPMRLIRSDIGFGPDREARAGLQCWIAHARRWVAFDKPGGLGPGEQPAPMSRLSNERRGLLFRVDGRDMAPPGGNCGRLVYLVRRRITVIL